MTALLITESKGKTVTYGGAKFEKSKSDGISKNMRLLKQFIKSVREIPHTNGP